jgi:hypothetical protein
MYALIVNDEVVKYPYSYGELKKDNPNVSFPKEPNDDLFLDWNVFKIKRTDYPVVDYTKNVKEETPQKINNVWTQVWDVFNASEDEIEQRTEEESNNVRSERDGLLMESDWTQVLDAPVDRSTWAVYRQLLRNVPGQPGFPWNVSWPEKP